MSDSTQGLTDCASCGIAFPVGARFCPSCGVALEPSRRDGRTPTSGSHGDPLLGRVIADRYRILSLLGRGGMGVVYRIEHVHIGKLMAMKLLSGELASDPLTLKRFQREAQAISRLSHPNTVQIFDFGESENLAYLVMEYLPGRDLASLIFERGALPFERVAKLAVQIAGSVEEAHAQDIIHRDIKPENVMVSDTSEQRDFVKVLDFGIAKLRDIEEGAPATQKGHLVGTPYYMAPEQIRGDPIDGRVDVYALGALMYKAVTGVAPFTADRPMEVLTKHLNEPLVPARERAPARDIPEEGERIIQRALAKDPADRYPSMASLRDDLLAFLAEQGDEADAPLTLQRARTALATRGDVDGYERRLRRTSRFGKLLALMVVVLAGLAGYAWWRRLPGASSAVDHEHEPNDTPAQSTLLVPGQTLRAQLGKRSSEREGDADVYRIELADEPRVADIEVAALPNVDLVVDLVEKGSAQPLLTANTGGVGEPERIPNYLLRDATYYVRVRERAEPGRYPTENVSDHYTIALELLVPQPDTEREPNDVFERAVELAKGARRGLIGWAGDRDVYCVAPSRARHVLEVSGVPELDLVIAALDRRTNVGQRVDRGGIGEGERVELATTQLPREVCFTISAREREGARAAVPTEPYQLVLR